jgi:iron complex transport system ATP-binding protein
VTAAVVLAGAAVRVGGRAILGPLDLSIGIGEQWVLLGPNGSGKTTALTLMGAWRQPSSGTVDVLGERLGADRCAHVAATDRTRVPTDWRNDSRPTHGPRDRVHRARGDARHLVADVRRRRWLRRAPAGLVGCAALADRPLESCSLGERQRVLMARPLRRDELLLFDEPAAGLDLRARATGRGPGDRRGHRATGVMHPSPRGDPADDDARRAAS